MTITKEQQSLLFDFIDSLGWLASDLKNTEIFHQMTMENVDNTNPTQREMKSAYQRMQVLGAVMGDRLNEEVKRMDKLFENIHNLYCEFD